MYIIGSHRPKFLYPKITPNNFLHTFYISNNRYVKYLRGLPFSIFMFYHSKNSQYFAILGVVFFNCDRNVLNILVMWNTVTSTWQYISTNDLFILLGIFPVNSEISRNSFNPLQTICKKGGTFKGAWMQSKNQGTISTIPVLLVNGKITVMA